MNSPAPLLAALCISLAACKPATSEPATTAAVPVSKPGREATAGRLLIRLTGETLGRNSAGDANSTACQLNAQATNESAVEIKSLHAEFTVRTARDNAPLPKPAVLTMPIRIASGATQAAWGPMYIDNHRCEDLAIAINPVLPGACQTTSKTPCPAYALTATGVARAE